MRLNRPDDFVADLGMPLQDLKRSRPDLRKSAGLCIVELQAAWTRACYDFESTFEFEPSSIARPAWEAVQDDILGAT
jgi:hypothetical protein